MKPIAPLAGIPAALADFPSEADRPPCYAQAVDRWEYKMQRRQERWARRQARWQGRHSGFHGAVVGLIIISIGVLFLLDNLGIVYFQDYIPYWPAILIAFGVARIADAHGPGAILWGGLVAGIGGLLLLGNLHIFTIDWRMLWPLLIIGWGVVILIRNLERRRYLESVTSGTAANSGEGAAPGTPPFHPIMGTVAIFTETDRRIDDKDFRSTEVTAIFGGFKLDLRDAVISAEQAIVDVNAIFGGVEIRVPETWDVKSHGIAVFGEFKNKAYPPRTEPGVTPPKLLVTGYAVFGGVKVFS